MAAPHAASKPRIPRDNGSERLQRAVDLSQPRFSAQTRRSYAKTLAALSEALQAAGADPSAAAIEAAARLLGPTGAGDLEPSRRHRGLLPHLRRPSRPAARAPRRA